MSVSNKRITYLLTYIRSQPQNNVYRVRLKNVPRRKLQFLKNGLIFQYEIFHHYSYGLYALKEKFYKILFICVEMAKPEIHSIVFASRHSAVNNGFVNSADADADVRGRGLCVFGGLCVDM